MSKYIESRDAQLSSFLVELSDALDLALYQAGQSESADGRIGRVDVAGDIDYYYSILTIFFA